MVHRLVMSAMNQTVLDETVSELGALNTTKQVAAFFGYTEHHVRRLVRLGELHAFQARANTPGNPIRIPRASVRRYLEKIAR
jgi:excisionase family DNA binding protein